MATLESAKHKFMVYAPDHTDPEIFQRRLSHRPDHLERAKTPVANGDLSVYCRNVFLWFGVADELRATWQRSLDQLSHLNPFSLVLSRR